MQIHILVPERPTVAYTIVYQYRCVYCNCWRVGGIDEGVDGLDEVVSSLREVIPYVIGVLHRMWTPVIMWTICNISPPVMVDGTYRVADFGPVFVIKHE